MSLVFDLPYCFSPWVRVDAAGQPIELSETLDDLERDLAERAEAREMAKVLAGCTELAEPNQRTVVELAGAGAAVSGVGAGSKSVAAAGGKVMLRGEATANKNAAAAQSDFNSKHPRSPAGSSAGGEFAPKGGGQLQGEAAANKNAADARKHDAAQKAAKAAKKGAAAQKKAAAVAKRSAHTKGAKGHGSKGHGKGKGKALTALSHAERHRLLVKLDAKLKAEGVSPRERLKVVKAAAHRLELAAMKPHDRIAATELDKAMATASRDNLKVTRVRVAAEAKAKREGDGPRGRESSP